MILSAILVLGASFAVIGGISASKNNRTTTSREKALKTGKQLIAAPPSSNHNMELQRKIEEEYNLESYYNAPGCPSRTIIEKALCRNIGVTERTAKYLSETIIIQYIINKDFDGKYSAYGEDLSIHSHEINVNDYLTEEFFCDPLDGKTIEK